MAIYRLVPEDDWQQAITALETLKHAGTLTLPDAPVVQRTAFRGDDPPQPKPVAHRHSAVDGLALAREVIQRVDAGGQRHTPKVFGKGPKIADFVYVLSNGSFEIPDVIDPVGKYVALKEARRDAGGQVRMAVKGDKRFRQREDGRYSKVAP